MLEWKKKPEQEGHIQAVGVIHQQHPHAEQGCQPKSHPRKWLARLLCESFTHNTTGGNKKSEFG